MVCCSFREEQISLQVQVEKVMNLYKSLLWKMVHTVRFILNYLFQSIHFNPSMFSKASIVISWPWESTSLPSGRLWVHTPTRPTTRVFKKLVRSCWLWFETLCQFRWLHQWAVTLSRLPCLLRPSFIGQIKGDIKEPALLFEKSISPVVWSTLCASRIVHIMCYGWVTVSSSVDW